MSSNHSCGDTGLQELTECPICYERFEKPLQLSCGHSYCGKCVKKLCTVPPHSQFEGTENEYEVECPECRRVTKVPPEGLPLNYRLQDLIAHVSLEENESKDTRGETKENFQLKCLVCCQPMDKGVYMSCHTCAYEHEIMSQMCSLCCLRSHNGHDIVEKPFLSDINTLIDSVSEATCHGLDAVYEALNELDVFVAGSKNILENSTCGILHEFEVIASEVQKEGISSQGKLERKIEVARRIAEELKKLPCCIKDMLSEFRKTFEVTANEFTISLKQKVEQKSKETPKKGDPHKGSECNENTSCINAFSASWNSPSLTSISARTDENAISVSTELSASSAQIQEVKRTHIRDDKTAILSKIPKRTSKQNRETNANIAASNLLQGTIVKKPDWSLLQSKIRTFIRDISTKSVAASSAAVLMTPAQKGHLLYNCKDGCLRNLALGDIGGCQFPETISKECFTNLWTAWIAADIFSRAELDMRTKMKWYKEQRCRGLRGETLKLVLKTAYQYCTDWRDFVNNTDKVASHPSIGGFHFVSTYNRVLRELHKDLNEENSRSMPRKTGPIGYIAGVPMLIDEQNVIAGTVVCTAATSFAKVVETLQRWNTYNTLIVTWPLDDKVDEHACRSLLLTLKTYTEEGGKVISAWPIITRENTVHWLGMMNLWKCLDEAISQFNVANQVFVTASNICHNGKVFIEVGSPEHCIPYYNNHEHDTLARQAYEAIRNRAQDAQLPCLSEAAY